MSNPQQLVAKLWNYCSSLRDDGLSYGDHVERLTYLLFLKMADEQTKAPFNKPSPIPKGFGWATLIKLDGHGLEIRLGCIPNAATSLRPLISLSLRDPWSQARHELLFRDFVGRFAHGGPPARPAQRLRNRLKNG